ncbi:MAG TPA: tyrosine-type recombinase/integrase [Phycisphaerae bacterium]|nr:tyrosine-type recombinase/integrase [Phycisphaerae bacterium]
MPDLPLLVDEFLGAHDFSPHTDRAIRADLSKFAGWFRSANNEPFDPIRITVRDVADFREHLARVRRQSVATVNRSLVSIRRFLGYLVQSGAISENPAKSVRELRRVPTVPKGLATAHVRKILREIEIRQDHRAGAIIGLMLYGGLRVSDVVGLTLVDVTIEARSGQAICRHGKGNKLRIVPLPNEARRLLGRYLESRPPISSDRIFVGERGALTDDGVRAVCSRYAAITGVMFTPHTLRHTFAHRFLASSNNDIVALAQILGHESLNTTAIYTKRSQDELQIRVDEIRYE